MNVIIIGGGPAGMLAGISAAKSENKVTIIENKPLARSLYYTVDLDREIPPELYGAVAEVLAFVYNVQKKKINGRN